MEIYFAGVPDAKILKDYVFDKNDPKKQKHPKLNVMLSYHLLNGKVLETIKEYAPYVNKFMLDSGAYSVYNKPHILNPLKRDFPSYLKNHKTDIEEYCECVFNLDYQSGEDAASRQDNLSMYLDLKDVYPDITPVIHRISSPDNIELDNYEIYNPKTIAIGQNIDRKKETERQLLIDTVNRIKKNSKCHLLGITSLEILEAVPNIDSCDSTSWNQYAIRGQVLFNRDLGNSLKELTIYFPDYEGKNPRGNDIAFDDMEIEDRNKFLGDMAYHFGLNKDDFLNTNKTHSRQLANLYYENQKIAYINRKHNPNLKSQ